MNFCLFTHTWAWVEGGYNIHTRHFGGFRTYLHTFTFLSYLFFQNTNVGIIVYVVVVVYTKNGTNPSKFRPRTHFHIGNF